MKSSDLEAITNSIQEKLGKENSALIADDIGKLISGNTLTLNEIEKKDNEIAQLKSNNEKLVIANGNLLQQVPMGKEYDKHQTQDPEEPKKSSFNFMSLFDEKGHFKK